MKKKLLLLLMTTFLFASCEKERISEEMYWFVDTYTIRSNQWELVNGANQFDSYFQARVSIPELSRAIYENGNVFCYMFQMVNNREVQTPLPFSLPFGEVIDGREHLWTETYSFDYSPGSITFYINYTDFFTSNRPDGASFRVVLNY
jgi:hypothetical protein